MTQNTDQRVGELIQLDVLQGFCSDGFQRLQSFGLLGETRSRDEQIHHSTASAATPPLSEGLEDVLKGQVLPCGDRVEFYTAAKFLEIVHQRSDSFEDLDANGCWEKGVELTKPRRDSGEIR